MTQRESLQKSGGSQANDTCIICCEPITTYALGPCNHRDVCAMCTLRMWKLYKKEEECCICKTPIKSVIYTQNAVKAYEAFALDTLTFHKPLGAYFDEKEFYEYVTKLWDFQCPKCTIAPFSSMDALRKHVKREHGLVYCDVCVADRKVFLHEQLLFEPKDLVQHNEEWDGGVAEQKRLKGHPVCHFCKLYLYGNDQLYEHLQRNHFTCHICERNNILYQYYKDYRNMERHFQTDHFLCPHPECLEKKFVVFPSSLDLKAHELAVHHQGRKTKADRQLEVNFTVLRAGRTGEGVQDDSLERFTQRRGRRRDEAGSSRESQSIEPPVPSATPAPRAFAPGFVVSASDTQDSGDADKQTQDKKNDGQEISNDTEIKKKKEKGKGKNKEKEPKGKERNQVEPDQKELQRKQDKDKEQKELQRKQDKDKEQEKRDSEKQRAREEREQKEQEQKELELRNKQLVVQLREAIGDAAFDTFRQISQAFRGGKITPREYHHQFIDTVGPSAAHLFSELIALLPDPEKRAILEQIHLEHTLWEEKYPSLGGSKKATLGEMKSAWGTGVEAKKKGKGKKKDSNTSSADYTCSSCGGSIPILDKEKHDNYHNVLHMQHIYAGMATTTISSPSTWATLPEASQPKATPKPNWVEPPVTTEADFPSLPAAPPPAFFTPSFSQPTNASYAAHSQYFADPGQWHSAEYEAPSQQAQVKNAPNEKPVKRGKKQVLLHFG